MGDKESFLGRLGRTLGFAVGAGALAAMLLSSATSEARPRRHYAQHQVNGNGKTLNSSETCAYETIKAELKNRELPQSFAPYVMALINKETSFSPKKTCPRSVRHRLERILKSIAQFDGLICPYSKAVRGNDSDIEAGIGAYMRPGFSSNLRDPCAAYSTLRMTGSSIRGLAETYRKKIAAYEAGQGKTQAPLAEAKKEEKKETVAVRAVEKPKPVEEPKPVEPEQVLDVKEELPATEKDDGYVISKPELKSVDDIIDVRIPAAKKEEPPKIGSIKTDAYAKGTDDLEQKLEAEAVVSEKAEIQKKADEGVEIKVEEDIAQKAAAAMSKAAENKALKKPSNSRPNKCRGLVYSSIDGKLYLKVKVRPNDSPWNIANNYTKSALNYTKIRRRNGSSIDDKTPLQPGERVYIPTNILKWKYRDPRCLPKRYQGRINKKKRKSYSARVYTKRRR